MCAVKCIGTGVHVVVANTGGLMHWGRDWIAHNCIGMHWKCPLQTKIRSERNWEKPKFNEEKEKHDENDNKMFVTINMLEFGIWSAYVQVVRCACTLQVLHDCWERLRRDRMWLYYCGLSWNKPIIWFRMCL